MPDRSYTYRVIVDTSSARTQAAAIKRVFERELSSIQTQNVQLVNPAALRNVQTAIQQQTQAQQQAAQQIAQTQQQVTAATSTQSQQRVAASQNEAAARVRNAQTAADQMIAQERRITQQTLDEQRNRQQGSGGVGGALNAAKGAGVAFLLIQGARKVAELGKQAAILNTQIQRTEKAFVTMSGGAATAEARLLAVQRASNGTADRLSAMATVSQIAALKLANTSKEFENLARAGKIVTLLSPQIKDFGDALAQLTLFSNSGSFARADQLALNPEDVKRVTAELQALDSGLSDSQAKLAASVQLLNQKGGALLDSVEAQASGYEKLTLAQQEFVQGAAAVGGAFDMIAGQAAQTVDELAVVFGVGSSRAIRELTASNAEAAKSFAEAVKWLPLINGLAERNANAYQLASAMLTELTQAVADAKPGALAYRSELEAILLDINRWGRVTDEQAQRLREIQLSFKGAADEAFDYARSQAAFEKATNRGKALDDFLSTLRQVDDATRNVADLDFGNVDGLEDWRKELDGLRSEFLQNGALNEEQTERLDFLSNALEKAAAPTSGLAELQRELGSSFLQNNEAAAGYIQQLLDLNAAYANGRVSTDAFKAGVEQIRAGLQGTAEAAQFDFNAALTRSTQAIAQLDQMIAAGTPGLTAWRDELTGIRDDIISTGSITEQQSFQVDALAVSIGNAAAVQADYGAAVNELGNAFFATNDRAREIAEQLNQLSTAYTAGAINADTYAASANSLRNELDSIAFNESAISTTSLDSLSQAITALDLAAAGGVPGLDTLVDQALNLEAQLSTTGLVTADQAAEIEYLSAVAAVASDSTGLLADINGALGESFLLNNEYAAALVERIILLIGAHESGAISSEVFAGALSVLTSQMVVTGEQAGLTAAQINAAFGELQAFSAAQSSIFGGTGGFVRGQRLAQSNVAAEQARERERVRIANERAAKESARAFKSAANEAQKAFEKAAKEFENALKNVPGLFGRSQVTDRQLKLAKAGVPQNFADDFLRRLEDEINQNADIWPDVSIEQAREALRKVGVNAVDDSKLAFEQLVEAWESGLLFSDKSNLELINADAVQAAIDLQEKTKQGQQNIIDHFKNVIGIAVDAATGVQVDTSGIGGTATTDKNIPDEITVTAPDDVQQVLTSGNITISSATLSAVALQDIATQLATQAFAVQVSKVTISATATQTLSEQMLTDMGTLKTKLETALQPSVKPTVTVTAEDYTTAKADLVSALAPNITPNITLDAADILTANDIIAALTPNIHPTLSLTEANKTAFISAVEALTPGVNTRLFAGVTEMSDYIFAVESAVKPGIATTLYATIEEMQLFRGIVETSVKPTVSVALKLEETTDEQGNPVSSLPDIAGQFADAIDKQISDTSERFSQQGTTIAGYLALAAYNYSFPDVISRYADLIDFQIAANQERLGVQGGNMTSAIAAGATTYVFPDVALTFVEAIEVQVRNNQDRFMRQGTNAMNLIVQGMNGFDFSFIATAMIAGVRAGMEQEAIKTALGDVGAGAMRTIRDGLENEAGNISWAGILTAAITESVLTELADSMEGQ